MAKHKLLISVVYNDNSDRYWMESQIKNKIISFDSEKQNIHKVIKDLCSNEDFVELTYKGKPQGNIYRDVHDDKGEYIGYETVGYMYRGKSEIHDRSMEKPKTGLFDVWVSISEVNQFHIEEIG